ncbi:hypothetical protein LVJ94_42110 [Pendulispora rubella]|uniref:Uncharacterized protein n=1 Tax=Pendulispora rubella TaxID=2741070 RepID=A0ABZ2KXR9_9BACT
MSTRIPRLFAALDLTSAGLLGLGVFVGLPDRWLYVDLPAGLLIALFALTAVGLFASTAWAEKVARATAIVALAFGLLLIALLALGASYLYGIYGPVGQGGALIYVLIIALAIPYLVALPVAQFLWFSRAGTAARP